MTLRFVKRALSRALCSAALIAPAALPAAALGQTADKPTLVRDCPPLPPSCLTPGSPSSGQPIDPGVSASVSSALVGEAPSALASAVGGEGRSIATGYIDQAAPLSQFRFRFDSAYDNNRPDRAEFFYPKCGCFRLVPPAKGGDPNAPGPILPETRVDYQEYSGYLEFARNNWSVFIEAPIRAINPTNNDNASGFGDLNFGAKYAWWQTGESIFTTQLRAYMPTGDADRGLGTDHVSLEPALLFHRKLSDCLALDAELRDWIPIGGTDFAGNVLRYGVGLTYFVYDRPSLRLAPVAEVVGWTVLGGKELDGSTGVTLDATGDTIVNAKLGVRTWFGENNSIYVGYGRALTGTVWYKDIIRVEYRRAF